MIKKQKICLALDVDNAEKAIELVTLLKGEVGLFKIGSELFTSEGPSIIRKIREVGGSIFLDLKFHDIPNTVAKSAQIATSLGVSMFNLHASGGSEMISVAVTAAREEAERLGIIAPLVLAVTVLTSIDANLLKYKLLVNKPINKYVQHLARMSQTAGADGVISSPNEVPLIRDSCGDDFTIITPGIRPIWASVGDQKRVTTPSEAINLGSNFIVIGRPILSASDPQKAARRIIEELENAESRN